jgi:hypothetical protein
MPMRRTLLSSIAGVLAATTLAGCADSPFRLEHGWTEQRALRYTWLAPGPVEPTPAYCYRTLAQPDCYERPQPREATRLIGYLGPEPY